MAWTWLSIGLIKHIAGAAWVQRAQYQLVARALDLQWHEAHEQKEYVGAHLLPRAASLHQLHRHEAPGVPFLHHSPFPQHIPHSIPPGGPGLHSPNTCQGDSVVLVQHELCGPALWEAV
jgi:hypothetical protein